VGVGSVRLPESWALERGLPDLIPRPLGFVTLGCWGSRWRYLHPA
jgi:hypothetical protein